MSMTMPVITSYSGKAPLRMAFVLPTDAAVSVTGAWDSEGSAADARALAAPTPSSPRVAVSAKPACRVAVREFAGFATPGEVARQLLELKAAIFKAGLAPQNDEEDCYQVFQYNPPTTLPFMRRNEIAIRLRTRNEEGEQAPGAEVEAPAADVEPNVECESDEECGLPSD